MRAVALLDLFFPPKCVFCGALLEDAAGDAALSTCAACAGKLPYRPEGQILRTVGGCPCAVTFYYEDPVRQGVLALKFGGKAGRARAMGRYIAQTAAEHLGGQFDAVTFVPVSALRNYRRGYDQARLLAEAAAACWGVRAEKILRKTRNNRPQSSVQAPEERRANVLGAYAVPRPRQVAGRRFLLIDDVCTTGSTMAAAAQALLDAGAASVVCAALAGGRTREKEKGSPPPESRTKDTVKARDFREILGR